MKKYLILLMMATTMLSSCSKDEDDQIKQVAAQELVGIWAIQNPTVAEVVFEGSNKELASRLKNELTSEITNGNPLAFEEIKFMNDMTCTATQKSSFNGSIEDFKGTYTVTNSRLVATLDGVKNTNDKSFLSCSLEKKGKMFFLVIDKQSIIDRYVKILLRESYISNDEIINIRNALANFTAGISTVRCPLKMIKR